MGKTTTPKSPHGKLGSRWSPVKDYKIQTAQKGEAVATNETSVWCERHKGLLQEERVVKEL